VGALEPQFFTRLVSGLGLAADDIPDQHDVAGYDVLHRVFAEQFATKTREEWTAVFGGTDACVTPVLTWAEAADNEHIRARSTLVEVNGVVQAAPAPRFSRTPAGAVSAPPSTTIGVDDIGW
jgi:alpha-methylacyl-CoA racemase